MGDGWNYNASRWYKLAGDIYHDFNERGEMGSLKRLVAMGEAVERALEADLAQVRKERDTLERRCKQTQSTLDVVLGERDAAREALRKIAGLEHSPGAARIARAALAGPPGYDDCFCTPNNPVHGCGIHDAPAVPMKGEDGTPLGAVHAGARLSPEGDGAGKENDDG